MYPVHSSPIQGSQSPARHTASPPRGPQPSFSRGRPNPFAPLQGIPHRSQGPNVRFHEFTNPLGINTIQGIHVLERINYTSTPPQHTLKPTASSCSLGQLDNEYVQERRDKDLPLECLHFPINSRFTEPRIGVKKKHFYSRQCTLQKIRQTRPLLFTTYFFTSHKDGCKKHHSQNETGESASHDAQLLICAASLSTPQPNLPHEFTPPLC